MSSMGKAARKSTGGFFGGFSGDRISLFKKREIIKPYLYDMDSVMIEREAKKHIKQGLNEKQVEEVDKLLPRHLINDIYSLYYNRADKLQFESLDKTNNTKFNIIKSINNSLMKVVTNQSHLASFLFTQEIGKYLYERFSKLTPEEKKELEKQLQGSNQGEEGEGQGKGKGRGQGDQEDDEEGEGEGDKPTAGNPNGLNGNNDKNRGERLDSQDTSDYDAKSDHSVKDSTRGAANNSNGRNTAAPVNQQDIDKMIESLINGKEGREKFEQAMKAAEVNIDKLKDAGIDLAKTETIPEEEQLEIINNLNNLDTLRRELQSLNVNKDVILKGVEKMLNSTDNYFSKKCITNEVELFDAEEVLDINGLELLHPVFRKSRFSDVTVTKRRYIGKFDLYIDCSGSMDAGCGGKLDRVSRIQLAKALALQMKELGILGDLYEFEDRTKKIMTSDISILKMAARGGTNVEAVMQKIVETGNNSVVLSDGESSISTYSHKAFFIGVGTDFSYFARNYGGSQENLGAGQKLVKNGQCVMFDGESFVTRNLD